MTVTSYFYSFAFGTFVSFVKKMAKSLAKTDSKVQQWVLTSIKDPEVEVVTITNDNEELERSLDELKYGGGGDFEEQMLKGGRNSFKTF